MSAHPLSGDPTFGERLARQLREEARRHDPGLPPFDVLTADERALVERRAADALNALQAIGCRIEISQHKTATEVAACDAGAESVLGILRGVDAIDLNVVLPLWQARRSGQWAGVPEVFHQFGRRFLNLGEPLLACDALAEGLQYWPADVAIRQKMALALARAGIAQRANALITRLHAEGHTDVQTLGLLARTHKDLWEHGGDPSERQQHLHRAYEFYAEAYRRTDDDREARIWTGINTATLALLSGRRDEARALAQAVRTTCLEHLASFTPADDGNRYYPLATLGEAAIILEEWAEAERRYAEASAEARGRFGFVASTRRNARLLLRHLGADAERIERHLRVPCVVVFTGHRVDSADTGAPRFPPQLEEAVRAAIRDRLTALDAGFGYASASGGADILFHEEMIRRGGMAHVVLPYERESFYRDHVETSAGPPWRQRYDAVLGQAAEVVVASKQRMDGDVSAAYTNLLLLGLAGLRGGQLGTNVVPLAAWDGRREERATCPSHVVDQWRRLGRDVEAIDLASMFRRDSTTVIHEKKAIVRAGRAGSRAPAEFETHLMAMLFADAVKFSELTEEEIPRFVLHFLGMVGRLLDTAAQKPVIRNTWGDGLYFVFESVRDAGRFALALSDGVLHTNWAEKGLPVGLSLRIALHAGPVYACTDPVTERRNFLGTHVSRAARIEPITPPGHVYSSQAFAALAAAERVEDFACDYVGQTPLPKNAGTLATYHVRDIGRSVDSDVARRQ